jgi:hypothetical protein
MRLCNDFNGQDSPGNLGVVEEHHRVHSFLEVSLGVGVPLGILAAALEENLGVEVVLPASLEAGWGWVHTCQEGEEVVRQAVEWRQKEEVLMVVPEEWRCFHGTVAVVGVAYD